MSAMKGALLVTPQHAAQPAHRKSSSPPREPLFHRLGTELPTSLPTLQRKPPHSPALEASQAAASSSGGITRMLTGTVKMSSPC